jgi:hypothetical protein
VPWFVAVDFKDVFNDILIEDLKTHINIAHQLHKNEPWWRCRGFWRGWYSKRFRRRRYSKSSF